MRKIKRVLYIRTNNVRSLDPYESCLEKNVEKTSILSVIGTLFLALLFAEIKLI